MIVFFTLLLLGIGIFLSAFFSGNETGFYRASRVRIVMSALEGDRISKQLLKLVNNPTWFVATTLIGNNVANYLTSLAIVLLSSYFWASSAIEMLLPILMSPILFVYGELLPKKLFYNAPNRLLRFCAPLFLLFTYLFAPAAALLWLMGKGLERLIGQSPEQIRLALARKELQQVLEEGLEAGILQPTQRQLAQSFFMVASTPVKELCTPISRARVVSINSTPQAVRKLAKRKSLPDIPVFENERSNLVGYVRTIDLLLKGKHEKQLGRIRPLMKIQANELLGEAVLQMQSARETLARVVDANGTTVGILTLDQLTHPLLEGPLDSLRR